LIFARILGAIVGALAAASLVFALEVALLMAISELFDTRLTPRGIGWLALPIIAGVTGWKIGWNVDVLAGEAVILKAWLLQTRKGRAALTLSVAWIALWTAYCWFNDDFGNYYGWREEDWLAYFGGLFGLPAMLAILFGAYNWVMKGKEEF
jgi:hypothetical protein